MFSFSHRPLFDIFFYFHFQVPRSVVTALANVPKNEDLRGHWIESGNTNVVERLRVSSMK